MNTQPTAKQRGEGVGFERIRRITGYLTSTLSRWNGAKQAEERDRVKHSVEVENKGKGSEGSAA